MDMMAGIIFPLLRQRNDVGIVPVRCYGFLGLFCFLAQLQF